VRAAVGGQRRQRRGGGRRHQLQGAAFAEHTGGRHLAGRDTRAERSGRLPGSQQEPGAGVGSISRTGDRAGARTARRRSAGVRGPAAGRHQLTVEPPEQEVLQGHGRGDAKGEGDQRQQAHQDGEQPRP
jgi:hypothetical protein